MPLMRGPRRGRALAVPTLLGIVLLAGIGFPLAAASGPLAGSMIHPWLVRSSVVPTTSPSCSSSGLCPSWVTTAYQFSTLRTNSSTNGTGQTVVIVDACGDASIISDLAQFDSSFGLAKPNLTVYQPQGKPCSDPFGWGIESALDVEWAHAIAPGASIALVEAASPSNTNLFGAWNYSLSHHLGNEISNSWGGGGGCPNVAKRLLSTASSQHVTVLASTGDSSAWGSGTLASAQFPADCSAVVGVGGTSLSVNSTGGYSSESAWNGGGGGYVPSTKEPSYQHKANITDSYAELGKPDVSAVADPATGVWVYEAASGGWFVVGGTSVACPIWAAYFADVNSWRATGALTALGNVVPFLYASVYGVNGGSIHYATTMHDVSSGSNGWAAAAGWDAATGIGSFRAYALASFLASSPTA